MIPDPLLAIDKYPVVNYLVQRRFNLFCSDQNIPPLEPSDQTQVTKSQADCNLEKNIEVKWNTYDRYMSRSE